VAFLAVLLAMWYSGSSQQNGAAYLLLFALAALGIVSLGHAFSNVRGLAARAQAIKPTFAGQETALPVEVANLARSPKKGLRLRLLNSIDNYETIDQLAAGKAARASIRFSAATRGDHEIKSICVETRYPLGLLRVTKQLGLSQHYLVYPKPDGDPKLPRSTVARPADGSRSEARDGDDFSGVRTYVPGESQRHIDWKAVARGQPMMTKQFSGESESGPLYLDYAGAAARSGQLEQRLSQLTLWIIEAERLRRPYGLRLPNMSISPSLGEMHYHRCLRALALY